MRLVALIGLLFAASGAGLSQGIITTMAGQPFSSCGALGDGGPATSAQLCSAQSATVDPSGNVYFFDWSEARIRKIATNGIITTIAGNGVSGTSGDGGPASSASLGFIRQLAVDPTGQRLCFGDSRAEKIRCITLSTGIIQGYGTGLSAYGGAGDGGNVANASFNDPVGAVFDSAGNLYMSDFSDARVRRIDAVTSIITTYAGPGPGYCCAPLGDGGPAAGANLYEPQGLAYFNGGLYIADTGNDRVRLVNMSTGIISTVAGDGNPNDGGVSDGGSALQAGIWAPWIAVDGLGNLFLDVGTAVRMVNVSGIITTIAGQNGIDGYGYDDIPARQTVFAGISGLGFDPIADRLLISDNGARIRQIFFTPSTSTVLTISPTTAYPGEQVTMVATVSPANATGSVRFHEGNTVLGSAPVNNGVATFAWTATSSNTYQFNAVYGGDLTHNLSSSPVVNLTVQLVNTSTALSSGLNPSIFGSNVTFTATVTPSTATGSVQLLNGSTLLGSAVLSSGKAQFTIATLPAGTNTLTADYGGDAHSAASNSAALSQIVNKAASSTTISASPATQSTFGSTITLTATVMPSAATGVVQFLDGSVVLGTATLNSGIAVFTTSSLAAGNHSIKASYSGDSNVSPSASSTISYKVKH